MSLSHTWYQYHIFIHSEVIPVLSIIWFQSNRNVYNDQKKNMQHIEAAHELQEE